ncbi:MAG: ATP synthase F1 subunit gamma [Deltaproteobacteria bacterium]|nr:ATP synthase F1 subunit gamma [Deltaproteobacteria bacterium]
MATLKDILRKIGAVKKTQQITKAMNMVAAARLRNSQGKMENFAPYAEKFTEVLGKLASRIDPDIHPLLVQREDILKVELLHFSADRGLCGSFNVNSINAAEKWVNEQIGMERTYGLTLVGKKGRDHFTKRGFNISATYKDIYRGIDISQTNRMTGEFISRFINGDIDELYMLYTRFINMAKQEPTIVKVIPVEPPKSMKEKDGYASEYLYEPDAESLLIDLLPTHISVQILNAFFQNQVSEEAARMSAMDNATKNCKEMVEDLTLIYNKARQAAITSELMDIVGGAEAIKKA